MPLPPDLCADGQAQSSSGWFAYGASMTSMVVENIQLNIRNVHIRLEDGLSLGGDRCFAGGIRIARLSVHTTNQFWVCFFGLSTTVSTTFLQERSFVNRQEGENLFKILEVEDFALYWDSDCQLAGEIKTQRQLTVGHFVIYFSRRSPNFCRISCLPRMW